MGGYQHPSMAGDLNFLIRDNTLVKVVRDDSSGTLACNPAAKHRTTHGLLHKDPCAGMFACHIAQSGGVNVACVGVPLCGGGSSVSEIT